MVGVAWMHHCDDMWTQESAIHTQGGQLTISIATQSQYCTEWKPRQVTSSGLTTYLLYSIPRRFKTNQLDLLLSEFKRRHQNCILNSFLLKTSFHCLLLFIRATFWFVGPCLWLDLVSIDIGPVICVLDLWNVNVVPIHTYYCVVVNVW